MTDDALMIAAAECLGITPDEVARLNTPRSELARMVADVQASRGKVAALDLPPGYEPGAAVLRLPDAHAMRIDPRARWVKPGPGQPAIESPLELAQREHESATLKRISENRRTPAAVKASGEAAKARSAKAQATRDAVATLTAQGKLPHIIAAAVGITARHVKRIQAAAKQTDITAAEK